MTSKRLYILDGRTATPHFPGIGRYVRGLLGAVGKHLRPGEDLAVILNPDQPALKETLDKNSRIQSIESGGSPFTIQQQWQIPNLLKRRDAQLYHSPYYLMPYRPGKPSLLTLYDVIPLRYPEQVSSQARMMFSWTTRLALRSASRVITISDNTRDDLHAQFKVDPEKVAVIPLAAGSQFTPQSEKEILRVREIYGLPLDYVLYFGINKPHKNLERLIDSFAHQIESGDRPVDHAHLVIAGAWDPRYPEARQKAEALDLQERVHFLGPIPESDLPGLYCGAKVFVFPSLYEGFGLPVIEAMACGVPVACSATSSLIEIASDSARLFDPGSIAAIAKALVALLSDTIQQEELRVKGLGRAAEYSWDITAARTLDLYRTL